MIFRSVRRSLGIRNCNAQYNVTARSRRDFSGNLPSAPPKVISAQERQKLRGPHAAKLTKADVRDIRAWHRESTLPQPVFCRLVSQQFTKAGFPIHPETPPRAHLCQ
jgi:hypothetical protein